MCSILESASDIKINKENPSFTKKSELDLIKKLSNFPEVVKVASNERAPYKITNYIHEVAENVHAFYTECRVIDRDNLDVTSARLALCLASKIVLNNALKLLGVSAPNHM